MTSPRPANNVVVIAVCVVFCFTVAACVAVFVASPEGANTGSLITILVGTLAPTIASLGLLVKVQQVDEKADTTSAQVSQIAQDTYRLTNGLLDAKVRAGVADVVPHLVHPDAEQQIEQDRRVRDHEDPEQPQLDEQP